MKRHVFADVLGLVATLTASAWTPAAAAPGGTVDETNEYANSGAWVVVEQIDQPFDDPVYICSGALVHPRVFLTAGHCTAMAEAVIDAGLFEVDDARISFGPNAFDPASWVEIEAIITHPGFLVAAGLSSELGLDTHDVGVVILKEPVVGVEPVQLPPLGLLDFLRELHVIPGEETSLPGYGSTPGTLIPPDGLRRVSHPEFQALRRESVEMSNNDQAEIDGAAPGDSGAPILWTAPDGTRILAATVLGGPVPAGATAPGNFRCYRTDIPQTLGFLEDVFELVEAGVFD
jgi:trypsin